MNARTNFLVSALLALGGCGPKPSGATDHAGSNAPAEAPPIPLGKPGEAPGILFTVNKAASLGQIGPAPVGIKAGSGETFVVVTYTLKNTGTKPLALLERPAINLVDGAGQNYAPDQMATSLSSVPLAMGESGIGEDLNPAVSTKATAAWKVAKADFDKAAWRLVVGTDPQLTFALK